jgi:hypothetical protein
MSYPFTNFTAASRKPNLIPFGYFSPGQSVTWIASNAAGVTFSQTPLVGTIDGINTIFTIGIPFTSIIAILRNGIVLDPAIAYSVTGSTVNFTNSSPYIPQIGDDLGAIIT